MYTLFPELQVPEQTSSWRIRENHKNLQKSRIEPLTMSIYDFLLNPESLDF